MEKKSPPSSAKNHSLNLTNMVSSISDSASDFNSQNDGANMEMPHIRAGNSTPADSLDQPNPYQLLQTFIHFHMQTISHLIHQMNLFVLVAFGCLFLLTLAIFFQFLSPWPLYLPSLFLAFALGFLSTQLHPYFTFIQAFKWKNDRVYVSSKPTHANQLDKDTLSSNKNVERQVSITKKLHMKQPFMEDLSSPLDLESFNVPDEDTDFPPPENWQNKIYPRFIEEPWVKDEIKRKLENGNELPPSLLKTWQLPSYSVYYPSEPLKIKGNSKHENTYINAFETPYFKGKILLRFSGLNNEMNDGYFKGKKRYAQTCIQGKFKYPYKFSEVLTGQIFKFGFNNLPPSWLVQLGFMIVKRLSPNMMVNITSDEPYVLSPLITAAQSIHIANDISNDDQTDGILPPDIALKEIPEETTLLGGHFSWKNLPKHERKNFFRDIKNLNNYSFGTEFIYTFDFYQHIFNPITYEFNCGVCNVDVSPYLNHQPIETMAVIDKKRFVLKEKLDETFDDESDVAHTEKPDIENSGTNEINDSTKQSEEKVCYLWRIQLGHEKVLKKR